MSRRSPSPRVPTDARSSPIIRSESSSRLLRNASGRLLRRENSGEISGEGNHTVPPLLSNSHVATGPSSFFVMITGHIESVQCDQLNDSLYCQYSFSYGPDWKIVHGVSTGLSQISRRSMLDSNNKGRNSVVVWNFPIEISFQSTNPHGWPRLALSIYGFDILGRDVVRGYASLLLPVSPGKQTRYLKTYRPVSGSKCVQCLNWLMGTNPEYYDSKTVAKQEGRAVTRVIGSNRTVKVILMVTVKDLPTLGHVPSPLRTRNC